MRVRKRGVEPGVWPSLHEKWRMAGWFTSQNCKVEIMGFILTSVEDRREENREGVDV